MKPFNGPRRQRGLIAIAIGAASAAYGAYEKNKQNEEAQQNTEKNNNQTFQDKAWLDQQQEKFHLMDRQYKENGIRQYAPFYKGPAMPDPKLTSTAGLADWQPDAGGQVPILSSSYPYAQPPQGATNG